MLVWALILAWSISNVVASSLNTARAGDIQSSSGKHGAVATEVGTCSEIGLDMLKAGGSAADAIIASSLCVGVIAAYHSGIGGGGFLIVRFQNKDGSHGYEQLDFRETAPAASNMYMYVNSSDPHASTIGGLAIGVPGELRGWELLHKRHGKLPWAKLFDGAIKLARDGFAVPVDLANLLSAETYPFLLQDPLWAEVYAPNGTLVGLGDIVYRKRYAKTLETLATHGADAFYKGEIAVNTAAAAYARKGILTTHDLANYSAIIRKPSNITYRNHRIFSTIAPSSGSIVLSALKIFEGFPGDASLTDPKINLTTHRLIEATRFGYGQRTWLGDPAFTKNVSTLEQQFLQESTAAAIRAKIKDNTTFVQSYYDPSNYVVLDDHGTSHLAAVDESGIAVSLTTTINLYWGSQVMTADGIVLNNEMDDFSSPGSSNSFGFAPSPVNFIFPGKRPQSSISSSIAEDLVTGEFVTATGSAGGSRIITATLQNLHHVLDQGLTPNASVHSSRWHDQLTNVTYFEVAAPQFGLPGIDNRTVHYLAGLGYNVTYQDTSLSTSHVISKIKGLFFAASDPRKAAGRGLAY